MYKALIIGAGQIAGGYDNPDDKAILSHAHAYIDNPEIELLGFYDVNYEAAEKMAEKWGGVNSEPLTPNPSPTRGEGNQSNATCNTINLSTRGEGLRAFKEPVQADIISICVPDEFHTKMVLEAEKLNPKLIFLEKPVCRDLKDIEILKNVKTPILVNYSRSFCKSFQELAKSIKSGEFGNYQSGFGYYGKGFTHNGSHMINLLNLLLGKIEKVEFKDEIKDFYEDDPSKLAILEFEQGGKFIMNPVDCRNYTVFELDMIFENARIKILNSGYKIEIFKAKESEKFKGYKMPELTEEINTDLDFALKNAVENAVNYLNGNEDLFCTLQDGIEAIYINSLAPCGRG